MGSAISRCSQASSWLSLYHCYYRKHFGLKMISKTSRHFFVSRIAIFQFFAVAGVFLISLFLAPYYFASDQIQYIGAYNAVYGHNFIDGFLAYRGYLSTEEPIHYTIVWIFSNLGFTKNVVMATANSVLAYLLMRTLVEWRVSIYVALALVLTNFYVLVLYFAAERLKFGFIFLLLAVLFTKRKGSSIFLAIVAIMAHIQLIILYTAQLFSASMQSFMTGIKISKSFYKDAFLYLFVALLVVAAWTVLGDHLIYKLGAYTVREHNNSIFGVWKSCVFLVLALIYSREKFKTVCAFSIVIASVIIVGPDRVNMMAYVLFMFYALQYKRGVNVGVAITSIYFAFKSIGFVLRIIYNGHGF